MNIARHLGEWDRQARSMQDKNQLFQILDELAKSTITTKARPKREEESSLQWTAIHQDCSKVARLCKCTAQGGGIEEGGGQGDDQGEGGERVLGAKTD